MFAVDNTAALGWLLALLAIWAALLVGSVIAESKSLSRHNKTATRLRLASSAILVIAAWSWYLLTTQDTPHVAEFALLVALGMTFGFLGDLLLAEALPLKQGFLAGIGAFAVGHVAYIAAILSVTPHVQWIAEGIALLIGLAGWYLVVFRSPDAGPLRWAALPYALLLATTAGLAAGLATQAGAFVPLAVGAALFLLSDLLVAGERFGGLRFPHVRDAIWLTYGPAQMLIVYAVNSALAVAGR